MVTLFISWGLREPYHLLADFSLLFGDCPSDTTHVSFTRIQAGMNPMSPRKEPGRF